MVRVGIDNFDKKNISTSDSDSDNVILPMFTMEQPRSLAPCTITTLVLGRKDEQGKRKEEHERKEGS